MRGNVAGFPDGKVDDGTPSSSRIAAAGGTQEKVVSLAERRATVARAARREARRRIAVQLRAAPRDYLLLIVYFGVCIAVSQNPYVLWSWGTFWWLGYWTLFGVIGGVFAAALVRRVTLAMGLPILAVTIAAFWFSHLVPVAVAFAVSILGRWMISQVIY